MAFEKDGLVRGPATSSYDFALEMGRKKTHVMFRTRVFFRNVLFFGHMSVIYSSFGFSLCCFLGSCVSARCLMNAGSAFVFFAKFFNEASIYEVLKLFV